MAGSFEIEPAFEELGRGVRPPDGSGERLVVNRHQESLMGVLHEVEKLLASMTRAEKAQLLRWVARDLGDAFPGIESTPGVCGGDARIVRTRIPVWLLEQARRQGASEADLLLAYPGLRAEDLANAWAYVRGNREEIERQLVENEAA